MSIDYVVDSFSFWNAPCVRVVVVCFVALVGSSGCLTQRCLSRPFDFATCDQALSRLEPDEQEAVLAQLLEKDRAFCANTFATVDQWLALGGELGPVVELTATDAGKRTCVYAALETIRAHVVVPGRRSARFDLPPTASPSAQAAALARIPVWVLAEETTARKSRSEAQCVGLVVRLLAARLELVDEPNPDEVERGARAACATWARASASGKELLGTEAVTLSRALEDIDGTVAALRSGQQHLFNSAVLDSGRAQAIAAQQQQRQAQREAEAKDLEARAQALESVEPVKAVAMLEAIVREKRGVDEAAVLALAERFLERVNASDEASVREVMALPLSESRLQRARAAWRTRCEARLSNELAALSQYPFVRAKRTRALVVLREAALAEAERQEQDDKARGKSSAFLPPSQRPSFRLKNELRRLQDEASVPLWRVTPAVTMPGIGACASAALVPPDPTAIMGEATLTGSVVVSSPVEKRMVERSRALPDTTRTVQIEVAPKYEPYQQCIRNSMGQCPAPKPTYRYEKRRESGGRVTETVEESVTLSEVTLSGTLTLKIANQTFTQDVRATHREANLPAACRAAARDALAQVLSSYGAKVKQWATERARERIAAARSELERLDAELQLEALAQTTW